MLSREKQLTTSSQLSPEMINYVISILEIADELATRDTSKKNEKESN